MKSLKIALFSLALLIGAAGCGGAIAPPIGGHGYPAAVSWIDHRLKRNDYILLIGLSRALPSHKPMTVYIMRHRVHLEQHILVRNTLVGIVVNPKHPAWMGAVYFQLPHGHTWTLLAPAQDVVASGA